MGNMTFCDVCYCPIKLGDKKFILGILEATELNEQETESFKQAMYHQRPYRGTKLYEICEGCKDVLEHFFYIRKDELEKVKDMLENLTRNRRRK